MDSRTAAGQLVRRHGTRNPFQIAHEMGYLTLMVPLRSLRGFYCYTNRCHIIYVNEALDEVQSQLVCAHELGHKMLHQGLNRLFMDHCTYMVTGKYERDAHRFSVELLYGDEELQPFLSLGAEAAGEYMGVTPELAAYRLGTVRPPPFSPSAHALFP